nr:hypothetical protein [Xanthomonas albilineans]
MPHVTAYGAEAEAPTEWPLTKYSTRATVPSLSLASALSPTVAGPMKGAPVGWRSCTVGGRLPGATT